MLGAATFSPCKQYRYTLHRAITSDDSAARTPVRTIAFLMLNPSTATEYTNDRTVAKCCTYARLWGFTDLVVVNIFAYRSTDPKALANVDDPVGPDNDDTILRVARSAHVVLCAWGNHGRLRDRGKLVTGMLQRHDIELYCIDSNEDGSPVHPLYQRLDKPFVKWTEAEDYGCSIH